MAQDYRDLIVWKRAIELTTMIYKLTKTYPTDEQYGLSSQLRRASVSVASNIAEGRGRLSAAEFRQFLGVAQGSVCELQTQLIISKSLNLGEAESLRKAESLSDEVSRMLTSLIQRLTAGVRKKKTAAETRS